MSNIQNNQGNEQFYQLFWEFEVWKKSEMINFKNQLKEKEEEHLIKLNDKYSLKEKIRENSFSKGISGISNLESKLRNKINEIQKRENGIGLYESELNRKIED